MAGADTPKSRGANLKSKSAKADLKFDQSVKPVTQPRKVHHGDVTRIYLSEIGRAKLLTADELSLIHI